jgi:hypothetical protein
MSSYKPKKSEFIILPTHTIIHVKRRDGTIYDVLVDNEDWCWLKEYYINVIPAGSQFRAIIRDANGIKWLLHRALLEPAEDSVVDHINCNSLDNRRVNLRLCSLEQNSQNRKVDIDNPSGIRGVSWSTSHNKWRATVRGKTIGCSTSLTEAENMVKEARAKLMPFSLEAL